MNQRCKLAWKQNKICQCCQLYAWKLSCSTHINTKVVTFNASNFSSLGHSHAGVLFTNEEQNNVGSWQIFNTFSTNVNLGYEVTDTGCLAPNGHTHGYVSTNFQTLIFNKWDEKLSEKQICIYMFYSIPIDTSCDMSSVRFPFKHCWKLANDSLSLA